jgi:hypothetical protein
VRLWRYCSAVPTSLWCNSTNKSHLYSSRFWKCPLSLCMHTLNLHKQCIFGNGKLETWHHRLLWNVSGRYTVNIQTQQCFHTVSLQQESSVSIFCVHWRWNQCTVSVAAAITWVNYSIQNLVCHMLVSSTWRSCHPSPTTNGEHKVYLPENLNNLQDGLRWINYIL